MPVSYRNQQEFALIILELAKTNDTAEKADVLLKLCAWLIAEIGENRGVAIDLNEYIYEYSQNLHGAKNEDLMKWFLDKLEDDLASYRPDPPTLSELARDASSFRSLEKEIILMLREFIDAASGKEIKMQEIYELAYDIAALTRTPYGQSLEKDSLMWKIIDTSGDINISFAREENLQQIKKLKKLANQLLRASSNSSAELSSL